MIIQSHAVPFVRFPDSILTDPPSRDALFLLKLDIMSLMSRCRF